VVKVSDHMVAFFQIEAYGKTKHCNRLCLHLGLSSLAVFFY
jgi:hypothetical protein